MEAWHAGRTTWWAVPYLTGATIARTAQGGGFFIREGARQIFVLPAKKDAMTFREGESVSIAGVGVVVEMPDDMDDRIKAPTGSNDDVYIYATEVTKQDVPEDGDPWMGSPSQAEGGNRR